MLMRSEPFREFDRLTEAMLTERQARQIPIDAYRRGNEFTVHFDLPGVDSRFIELTVEKDLLSRADAYAKRAGLTRARFVGIALESFLTAPRRNSAIAERRDY